MTDESIPVTATDPDDTDPFTTVPTAGWAHSIEARVADLETADSAGAAPAAPVTATLSPEQEEQILTALRGIDSRLDRHRTEMETIKKSFNELLNYVIQSVAPSSAVIPTEIPAGTDTVQ